ncbi:hypothetical protein BVRB_7g180340 [Beta vulgaris subsp. vulgaris]|uniref:Uncharacterized protein n=1 Tax=Beta vulgaris subsp. vulgaris TaxID=3555 RepID=A0A0J8BAG3_BETVV|nr:hypothetical protein BVRB_7g180340 [Beta vulgaris subsp. vulgaris]
MELSHTLIRVSVLFLECLMMLLFCAHRNKKVRDGTFS